MLLHNNSDRNAFDKQHVGFGELTDNVITVCLPTSHIATILITILTYELS